MIAFTMPIKTKSLFAQRKGLATKIANALEVSIDYLVGKTELELDDFMLRRVQAVSKMTDKDKDYVFSLLDAFIAKTQMQGFL